MQNICPLPEDCPPDKGHVILKNMAYRKISFTNNEYYHVYNRGIDKRVIFETPVDFQRFADCLQFFNSFEKVEIREKRKSSSPEDSPQGERKLVDVICYCLMPNHFHLLLKQRVDNGITTFMKKMGTGYSMYFNITRERTGSLFQGPYKAKAVKDNDYLTHLSRYIHMNPVDLIDANWKEVGIKNKNSTHSFIEKYPWSSYADYVSGRESKIISKNILHELFSALDYVKFVQDWDVNAPEDCPPEGGG